jgi:hypothetical protein
MNSVPSSTLTFNETHDPDGQDWMLLSTNAVDQIGSGPHPNSCVEVEVVVMEAAKEAAAGRSVDDDLTTTAES